MNSDGQPTIVCWDCIKGRHSLCTGKIPEQAQQEEERGQDCECPVCHANRCAERQPVYDGNLGVYYDPGPIAEPRADW